MAICLTQLSYAFIAHIQGFDNMASTTHLIWYQKKKWPNSNDRSIAIEKSHTNICLVMALFFFSHDLSWTNPQALILVPLSYAREEMLNLCFNVLNTRVLNCTLLVLYVFLLLTQLYSRKKATEFHN